MESGVEAFDSWGMVQEKTSKARRECQKVMLLMQDLYDYVSNVRFP
jgi:hypothetical protein